MRFGSMTKHFLGNYDVLDFISWTTKYLKQLRLGVVVLAINPNSQEAEADGSYESGLHSEFQANGEYSEALSQTNKQIQ